MLIGIQKEDPLRPKSSERERDKRWKNLSERGCDHQAEGIALKRGNKDRMETQQQATSKDCFMLCFLVTEIHVYYELRKTHLRLLKE